MQDQERAIGQFVLYRTVLAEREPDRALFLAVPQFILQDVFEQPLGELLIEHNLVQVVGFDPDEEVIVQWKT